MFDLIDPVAQFQQYSLELTKQFKDVGIEATYRLGKPKEFFFYKLGEGLLNTGDRGLNEFDVNIEKAYMENPPCITTMFDGVTIDHVYGRYWEKSKQNIWIGEPDNKHQISSHSLSYMLCYLRPEKEGNDDYQQAVKLHLERPSVRVLEGKTFTTPLEAVTWHEVETCLSDQSGIPKLKTAEDIQFEKDFCWLTDEAFWGPMPKKYHEQFASFNSKYPLFEDLTKWAVRRVLNT